MPIEIRDAVPDDGATIADYNARMAEETEDKRLDPQVIGPGVAAVLEDATKGRYWVAIIDGEIAGQLMVSYEWSDWRNGTIWWIQSVYVATPFRRQGVFSALYKHVESLAKQDGSLYLFHKWIYLIASIRWKEYKNMRQWYLLTSLSY